MAVLKCKMCGGDLVIEEGKTVCECEYCGSRQTLPVIDNEKKITLYERANRLRFNAEFDKAAGVYEQIIAEFHEEAEAYWGILLCKYGIEYIDDPTTGKKVPTCHRSSFDSFMDDEDFEMVMENSDAASRAVYREQAKEIEEIRKGIIEIFGKEEPYDIFICYKETDENGERTIDSVIAQDVYDALTDKGYRVFFSRISLEDKLGVEYEPYIFAALHSAKVMLAFGTTYDYYNAVWVKNEWSRFLKLMEKDKSKHLIPCYKNLDAYDIPKEFAKLQGQDFGKVGAIQDLIRGIDKLMGKEAVLRNAAGQFHTITLSKADIPVLLERGNKELEDGKFEDANKTFLEAVNIDSSCAEAYIGIAMSQAKCGSLALYGNLIANGYETDIYYEKAKQYASQELKSELEYYEVENAIRLQKEAKLEAEKREKEEAKRARIKADRANYENYRIAFEERKVTEIEKIKAQLSEIEEGNYKLSEEEQKQYDECLFRMKNIEQKLKQVQEELIEKEDVLQNLEKSSTTKKEQLKKLGILREIEKKKLQNSIKEIETSYDSNLELVNQKKKELESLKLTLKTRKEEAEKYYQEASDRAKLCLKSRFEFESLSFGDTVTFGHYKTENNVICNEWIVIFKGDAEGGIVFLISKYAICPKAYNEINTIYETNWEYCSLRTWLNKDYLEMSFSPEERTIIRDTSVRNTDINEYGLIGGKNTPDKIFLMSIESSDFYLSPISELQTTLIDGTKVSWWLRSPGWNYRCAAMVSEDGSIHQEGCSADDKNIFVRPALYIHCSNPLFLKYVSINKKEN